MAHGHVPLVTGSSRGLGAAIAGAWPATASPSRSTAGPATTGWRPSPAPSSDDGGIAAGFCADVTAEDQVNSLVTAITSAFGPVDVLVLNATGPQPEAPVTEVGWADHVAQLDFFVKSPVLLGRAVLPGCRPGGTAASSASTPRSPTGRRRGGPPTPPRRTRRSA